MATTTRLAKGLGKRVQDQGLEQYILELELDGLTILPPEVHRVPLAAFDEMTQLLLDADRPNKRAIEVR